VRKEISSLINPSYTWEPCSVWYGLIGSVYSFIEIRVYDWISKDKGIKDFIGSCRCSVFELILGTHTLPLINPTKISNSSYKSSGGFEIQFKSHLINPPQLYPATGYHIKAHVENYPLVGDRRKEPISSLKVIGKSAGSLVPVTLFESIVCQKTSWDIFVPFEEYKGCFDELKWKYYDGKFTASLYEFTLRDPNFYFMCKSKSKKDISKIFNLKRLHAGQFVIDSITPVYRHIMGYNISFQVNKLDIYQYWNNPDPYLMVKDPIGNVIYTTETCSPILQWRPFDLVIGPDFPLDIECWVAFSSGAPNEYIGSIRTNLRNLFLNYSQNVGELFLINPILKERIPSYNNSGYLTITNMTEILGNSGPEWPQPLPLKT